MTVRKILEAARNNMNHGGEHWTQDTFIHIEPATEKASYCMAGGVLKAAGCTDDYLRESGASTPEAEPALVALAKAIVPGWTPIVGESHQYSAGDQALTIITDANDRRGTVWGHVYDWLTAAAKAAD